MSGKERPIIFSGPEVRAILGNRKTQARRIFTPERIIVTRMPDGSDYYETFAKRNGETVSTGQGGFIPNEWMHYCPFGIPGDRLWVKEKWCLVEEGIIYREDGARAEWVNEFHAEERVDMMERWGEGWRASLHMPRWASRITLEVTGVRVERVQEITPNDACSEGVFHDGAYATEPPLPYPVATFKAGWDTLHKPCEKFSDNPWVWVVEFRRIEA